MIDLTLITERLKGVPPEASKLFMAALSQLIAENKTDLKDLPPEMFEALLARYLVPAVTVPDLTDDDPIEMHGLQAELLAKHAAALKACAIAQKSDTDRYLRLSAGFSSFALKIGPIIGGLAVKAILGG